MKLFYDFCFMEKRSRSLLALVMDVLSLKFAVPKQTLREENIS